MSSTSWRDRDKIRVFNTVVDNVLFEEAKEILEEMLDEPRFHKIFTPNTEIVMTCRDDEKLACEVNSADLVVADGIGLVMGSKMRDCPLLERVTGFDLSVFLLELAAKKGAKVFFLGAEPGVAETAKARVEEKYGDIVAGVHHGYFKARHGGCEDSDEEAAVVDAINRSGAEILFVGLGFPKQEKFILNNQDALEHVRIAIGNGGVLDVLAGKAKRAPEIFIRCNLEWLYRLIKNPSRLSRQMVIPKFLWKIRRDKDSVSAISSTQGGSDAK
ncbi:MAG: WecB/TagA/CpsF family glycosyltransferase [Peptoniphilus sp.]|nr:WecB/TagA/CpsF family glycosyltransferase [Peptoniphilus sp.]MDD7362570.1 WecB/TagA/CpsF family glycosyltransferase [Bacillota bacterium]MDY6045031.1 WecB/TagA/CpsF family glycosyltransferase [Peptoniphilus sp.]